MLFMSAGVSHIDTFDYKPDLAKFAGKPITGKGNVQDVFFRKPGNIMPSPFKFKQHGSSGAWLSELLPHTATIVDEMSIIKTVQSFTLFPSGLLTTRITRIVVTFS